MLTVRSGENLRVPDSSSKWHVKTTAICPGEITGAPPDNPFLIGCLIIFGDEGLCVPVHESRKLKRMKKTDARIVRTLYY